MGTTDNHNLNQLSLVSILNLQLQWTPMGSNGNHHPGPLRIVSFLNLQLQWTPMLTTICVNSVKLGQTYGDADIIDFKPYYSFTYLNSCSCCFSFYNNFTKQSLTHAHIVYFIYIINSIRYEGLRNRLLLY